MNERAISIISDEISQINVCKYSVYSENFKQLSYTKWALREILFKILHDKSGSAIEIVEDFKRKFDKYSCMNSNSSLEFSIAYDASEYILNRLLQEGVDFNG